MFYEICWKISLCFIPINLHKSKNSWIWEHVQHVFNLKYIFLMLPDKNSKGSIYSYHLHLSYIWSKWFPDDLLRFMWWSSLFYDMKVYIKKIQVKRCFFMLCPFEKWKISKILLSSFIWHKSLFFFVITSGYKRKVRYDFDDDAIYHFWVMPLDT